MGIKQAIGRFAPSPTGELHLGSLVTAVASYCHIKSLSGKWLLRIEDVDRQRCQSVFSQRILNDLSNLGLHWDDEVIYQSQRTNLYNEYVQDTLKPHIYACECSRKSLTGHLIYPKNCVDKSLDWQQHKLRIQLPDSMIGFDDGILGRQVQKPQTSLGDMVIRRDHNSQNMINYILAVSIDDGLQGVTHVMRGLDILPMTSAQIAIMHMAHLPAIHHWYHLPLVKNEQGQKLSKQNLASPIDSTTEQKCSQLLSTALTFLNQPKVEMDTPENMLAQAVMQWDNQLYSIKLKVGQ